MKYIAGVDIGNATTESAIGKQNDDGTIQFLGSGLSKTTGVKGTEDNIEGVKNSIDNAIKDISSDDCSIDLILINEAAPVIGDFAMDTVTETVITESALIGHNPDTPGGIGLGIGFTVLLSNDQDSIDKGKEYVVVADKSWEFMDAAKTINDWTSKGIKINGAIIQNDDGVLIHNRIDISIPIVDEVRFIDKVPIGEMCAVEVAEIDYCIDTLSNPYGLATIFKLDGKETQQIAPIAKALIGSRSAVVIKTPKGKVIQKTIKAGDLVIQTKNQTKQVAIESGGQQIMESLNKLKDIEDIFGEAQTNIGGVIENIRTTMAKLISKPPKDIHLRDILAVDTIIPKQIDGGLANEFSQESAVCIAAMIQTDQSFMKHIANKISENLGVQTKVGGIEGNMAVLGALTTPGTEKPIAVVDIGAGSVDASSLDTKGNLKSIHLAGAGDMVTKMINSELALQNDILAEDIKKYPLAKVESLFHIRHENGKVQFFEEHLAAEVFSKVVVCKDDSFIPVHGLSMEKIREVRRRAKNTVLVQNTLRALKKLSVSGNLHDFDHVVLVGGSFLDFEVPNMVTETLLKYGITAGKGNIRGTEGPRNSVATGLIVQQERESNGV